MSKRLLSWSLKTNTLVPLVPTGMGGGQVDVFAFENDPEQLGLVPLAGDDPAPLFAKARALAEAVTGWPRASVPSEVLVQPRDKATPVAIATRRMPGRQLEELFFPAERAALGLNWDRPEWAAVVTGLAGLFATSEHKCVVQNDNNPANFLVEVGASGEPAGVYRIDTQSFGFWHKTVYYGCEKARWEYVPPELQWLGRRPEGLKGFQVPREADRYALAALAFGCLTGALPWEYVGGDPDPVKRVAKKQFAVLSMPKGAKVPDEVEAAFYGLPAPVTTALERGLLGDPGARPTPVEWVRLMKALAPPRRVYLLPPVPGLAVVGRFARLGLASVRPHAATAAGIAALGGALWCLPTGGEPAAPPVLPAHATTTEPHGVLGRTTRPAARPDMDVPDVPRKPADRAALHALNR